MTDCIFCKIAAGAVPCFKLYEDKRVIAFLDLRQVRPGHTMVIPKHHVDHFIDLEDDIAMHICKIGNLIGRKIQETLKPKRVGFAVSGFGVAHAHYHVVPMHEEFDVTSAQYAVIEDGKIAFRMNHIPIASQADNQKMADLLKL